MGGFNINCKKCKKFMIYDKYSFIDDEDYYCIKCWWYKVVLPMLKKCVSKKDIEDYRAYYFYYYDRDMRFN